LFIRLFTKDDLVQTPLVVALFRRAAAGEFTLFTTVSVITEIVWILEKKGVTSNVIRNHILSILNTPGIEVENATLVGQAADIYAGKNIDFVDACSICSMKANNIKVAYTFDHRHFSRVDGIEVRVP
jgi:predicted nucleic-acid-binding protein